MFSCSLLAFVFWVMRHVRPLAVFSAMCLTCGTLVRKLPDGSLASRELVPFALLPGPCPVSVCSLLRCF